MAFDELYFDAASVSLDCQFIESLTLTKSTRSGRPEPFRLLAPHRKLVANLLGWKKPDETTRESHVKALDDVLIAVLICPYCKRNIEVIEEGIKCGGCAREFRINLTGGVRSYRRAYFTVARKNAKTQITAAIGLDLLVLDGEASPEIYIAARDRDQAGICYSAAAALVNNSADLCDLLKITDYRKEIRNPLNSGILRALSSDGKGKHGYNPHVVIFDEFHTFGPPEQELYDALTTGSVARRQPIIIIITTAGVDEYSLCGREYEYACRVRDRLVEDITYLPLIYELPREADWADETLWHLANPTLGEIVKLESLREACNKALVMPSEQTTWRRLNCNQWVNASDIWIPTDAWDRCAWTGTDPLPSHLQSG